MSRESMSYLLLTPRFALIGVGPAIGAADRCVVLWTCTLVIETIAGHPQG